MPLLMTIIILCLNKEQSPGYVLFYLSSQQPYEIDSIITSIFHVKN